MVKMVEDISSTLRTGLKLLMVEDKLGVGYTVSPY